MADNTTSKASPLHHPHGKGSGGAGRGRSTRIIIAGGGTGGHIFPAIAIANALTKQEPGIEILFIGARGKMEMEKVPQAGYQIEGLDIAGLNRQSMVKNVALPFKVLKSFFRVRSIMKSFQPDAVIGVGGYSTYPVLRYAQTRNIPTFIHESNSFAGRANIMLGKKAARIFVASDRMEMFFPKDKIMITGNPVRSAIAHSTHSRADGQQFFGLDAGKKTVLAVGGSLGARSINEAIAAHIDVFEENGLQLIWQTGKTTAAEYKHIGEGKKNIWVNDFIREMEMAYAAADIVISRAGAMAVTELCVAAKPTIFVPYPLAAEDHQTSNAMNLVHKHAALIVKDNEAKEKLVAAVVALAKDEAQQRLLQTNIHALAVTNADEVVAAEILKHIR
ncbi:undecaprenyldiphospho-muramoylpentapeptide beta-N-acetylglucosaminyltransferase [Sediminibacterium roseum]|uniref:UDP-N-acetylglucosamine--N-acetylmuramyl-(pentapeptide) pyrophosphoryl-undecaprenol N-acetylglucosamine transferase n=1 Tax=Sediminibacterium roseum TaxID=1978412 RepID=A0ABW9ZRR5_9BACT|nr:undecaprenyldiphospho-muramoylpentapeptide beta-N-acetylglucosaminyltransferase [Sediminibacterium roseum]NCI49147.1 undecaprenyldiphospho-muramoylpentapeptide beta-N-acetylglucosaminyltransferase [Sediminibacterium roseum]